jgi:uncharacterized protein (TIGR02246 family)
MSDDVIFLVPGRAPFGKDVFAAGAREMKDVRMRGVSEVKELEIAGNWAWIRNRITLTMTPPGGEPVRRSGYTLSILKKQPGGKWLLVRDANLVTKDE